MNDQERKILEIFSPNNLEKWEGLIRGDFKFVQYTSAEAAMNIIKSGQFWMRNAQCMNDFMELQHGYECLRHAYKNETEGERFKNAVENIFPGVTKEITDLFDGWWPHLQDSVYIACLSEHPVSEDKYGRLSMWRAYGGEQPVALVLNNTPFLQDTSGLKVFSAPVMYMEPEQFIDYFGSIASRIEQSRGFLESLGRDTLKNWLFELFKSFILSIKHPGFSEEKEWRIFYTPMLDKSDYVLSDIVSVNNVPQEVHKIPLQDIPEISFTGADIPTLLHKVIIGPTDQQLIIGRTFRKLLADAGCENANSMITYSGIPLR